jgi:hypothetical protein
MQVNVFITRQDGQLQNRLLVLPISPTAAIPKEYRSGWSYYATLDSADAMFSGLPVDADLAAKGFAVVEPETPDRR